MKNRQAFTLIEMLVVIAIIGIVAAMLAHMGVLAGAKNKTAQVEAEKRTLILLIDSYQSKLNYYPPDNGALISNYAGPVYDALAATNPLLYELTGATNTSTNTIILFDGSNLPAATYNTLYNRASVANGNADEPHNFFAGGAQFKEYTNYYDANPALTYFKGMLVPVNYTTTDWTNVHNFWHYDSSTTNRHNLQSYDLWAEYTTTGTNIVTNGNW